MVQHGKQVQKLIVHQPWHSAILWLSTVLQFGETLHIPISSTYNWIYTTRTITGTVRCTMTGCLPVLSSNAPAYIRREVTPSRTILRARDNPELHLVTDIDFHPRPRLKSRRPIWSNLSDEAPASQHLWRTRWNNQIFYVPNK